MWSKAELSSFLHEFLGAYFLSVCLLITPCNKYPFFPFTPIAVRATPRSLKHGTGPNGCVSATSPMAIPATLPKSLDITYTYSVTFTVWTQTVIMDMRANDNIFTVIKTSAVCIV